jgi:DNA-binding transcriptional MerR regulator
VAEKAPEAFRTISEVASDLDLPQHVLRFWETRFQQIKPLKRGGGRRYYRPDDVDLLRGIRHLLYSEGYTIRGAQRLLKDHGIKFVQNVWRAGAPQPTRGSEAAEPEIPEAPPLRPQPPSARRGDTESAHRRLFGLLPSLLSSEPDEERLAESRRVETDTMILPSPLAPRISDPAALPPESVRKLQDALRELQECRRLLDTALHEASA